MQPSTYISDLLYRYECVIIPGFGAFLTRNQSAQIDSTTNTFHPPSKVISFNRQLQANDGLLANYLASVEQCSYATAIQKIRDFAGQLTRRLQSGETVTFDKIGKFSMNDEGAIQFEPQLSQNYSTSAFGLTTFTSEEIQRETQQKPAKGLEKELPITSETRSGRPYLKYAAIAAIAMMASGFAGMKLYEDQVQRHNFAERQKANSLVENQIQEATFVIENPLPVLNMHLPKHTGNYHIVAGAFRMEENAEKKMDQLRKLGYSPMMLEPSKYGLFQVLYSSFENRREALNQLYKIQRTENSDAWLLVKEIK